MMLRFYSDASPNYIKDLLENQIKMILNESFYNSIYEWNEKNPDKKPSDRVKYQIEVKIFRNRHNGKDFLG
jgi:hypothetical protein